MEGSDPTTPNRGSPISPTAMITPSPPSDLTSSIQRAQEIDSKVLEESERIRAEAMQFLRSSEMQDETNYESANIHLPNYETGEDFESQIKLHTSADTRNKDYYKELGHMKSIILGLSEKLHINMVHREEVDILRTQLQDSIASRMELEASIEETTEQLRNESLAVDAKLKDLLREKQEQEAAYDDTVRHFHAGQKEIEDLTAEQELLNKTITLLKGKVFNFADMQALNEKVRAQLADSEKTRSNLQNAMKSAEQEFAESTNRQIHLYSVMNTEKANLEGDVGKLRAELVSQSEQKTEEVDELKRHAAGELDQVQAERTDEIQQAKQALQNEIETSKKKLMDELFALRKQKDEEIATLSKTNADQMTKLIERNASEMDTANAQAKSRLESKQAEMDQIRANNVKEIARVRDAGEQECAKLKARMQGELDATTSTFNSLVAAKDSELEQLKATNLREMSQTRKSYEDKIEAMTQRHEAAAKQAQQTLAKTIDDKDRALEAHKSANIDETTAARAQFEAEVAGMRANWEANLEALRKKMTADLAAKTKELEDEKKNNYNEMVKIRNEIDEMKATNSAAVDKLVKDQNTEIATLTSNSQDTLEQLRTDLTATINARDIATEKARQAHLEELTNLKDTHTQEQEELRNEKQIEIDNQRIAHERQIAAKDKEMEQTKAKHIEELTAAGKKLEATQQAHLTEKTSDHAEHAKEIEDQRNKMQTDMDKQRAENDAALAKKDAEIKETKDQHLAEQVEERKKQEAKQQQHLAEVVNLKAAHTQATESQRAKMQDEQDKLQASYDAYIQQRDKEADAATAKHLDEVSKMNKEREQEQQAHLAELTELKTAHNTESEALRNKKQKELDELQAAFDAAILAKEREMEATKAAHLEDTTNKRKEHEKAQDDAAKLLDNTKKEKDNELKETRTKLQNDLEALRNDFVRQIAEKDATMEQKEKAHLDATEVARKKCETEHENLRNQKDQELEKMRKEHGDFVQAKENELQQIKTKNLDESTSTRNASDAALRDLRTKMQQDMDDLRRTLNDTIDEKQQQMEAQQSKANDEQAAQRQRHENEINAQAKKSRDELDRAETDFNRKIKQLQQDSDKNRADLLDEMNALREQKEQENEAAANKANQEMQELNTRHTQETAKLNEKASQEMAEANARLEAFRKEKEGELEMQRITLTTELNLKQKALDVMAKESTAAINALEKSKQAENNAIQANFTKQINALREEKQDEIDKLRVKGTEMDTTIAQLNSKLAVEGDQAELIETLHERSNEHEKSRAGLAKQIETTTNDFTQQSAVSKQAMDETNSQKAEVVTALDNANNDIATQQLRVHELEIQAQDMINNIATLEQLCCKREDLHLILDQNSKQIDHLRGMKDQLLKELSSSSEYIVTQSEKSMEESQHLNKMKEVLEERSHEINALKQLIVQLRNRRPIYVPVGNDPVDVALAEYLNAREEPLMVPLIREDREVYNFGTKRIFIKLEQGKIIIRVGGGFMQIEEFLEIYTPIELEKAENRQSDVHPSSSKMIGKLMHNELDKSKEFRRSNTTAGGNMSPQKAAAILRNTVAQSGITTGWTKGFALQRKSPDKKAPPKKSGSVTRS